MTTVITTMERLNVTLKQSDEDGNDVGVMEIHTDKDGDANANAGNVDDATDANADDADDVFFSLRLAVYSYHRKKLYSPTCKNLTQQQRRLTPRRRRHNHATTCDIPRDSGW